MTEYEIGFFNEAEDQSPARKDIVNLPDDGEAAVYASRALATFSGVEHQ